MKLISALAVTAALAFAPLCAHADDDIVKHLISNPNVGALNISGKQTNTKTKDPAVQGGNARHVVISGGGNPWDAQAQVDVTKKIVAGDEVVCAIWLKGKSDDGSPVRVHLRLQENSAPYTGVGESDVTITDQWQLYSLNVTPAKDYDKNKLAFAVHLNTGKQVIDLGPSFVLDMTQTY